MSFILLAFLCTFASDKSHKYQVNYTFTINHDSPQYSARLWLPMPYSNSSQKLSKLSYDGSYDTIEENNNNPYTAPTLFASWNTNTKKKTLTLSFEVSTKDRTVPLKDIKAASKKNRPLPDSVLPYLQATKHIPTTGVIKELSQRITQGKQDRFEKVTALYMWATSHTFRDPAVIGCGLGDVNKMITSSDIEKMYREGYYGGKCTDLNSLFTALVRAAGIPAREVFGIRLGKSAFSKALGKSDKNGFATISEWQHCRAEYYIPGIGWIAADPADITKLMLVEDLPLNHPKVQELRQKYLHSWEMNWIGFNYGRDFILSPKPTQFPINMFGYPYGEVEDEVLNYYDPATFSYTITSQEVQ